MFFLRQNRWLFSSRPAAGFKKKGRRKKEKESSVRKGGVMEEQKPAGRHKGGRPRKTEKRDQQLAVMCTVTERKIIEMKAREGFGSVSEFLRTLGMGQPVHRKIKTLPKEVLLFTATLHHLAANINQLTKKHNQYDLFSDAEIIHLQQLIVDVKQLVTAIKNSLA